MPPASRFRSQFDDSKAKPGGDGEPGFTVVAKRLQNWFRKSARDLPWRGRYDPWQVWVSEIMAQQTRIEVVVEYFDGFIARFPDVRSLAAATVDEVLAAWSGLGYYRRARLLHAGAGNVVERFGGEIPSEPDLLRSIPGIGRYTAGAIASIAFGKPAPIVDGNVSRLLGRLYLIDLAPGSAREEIEWRIASSLVQVAESPG
ncbi:MAG: A/G-specific adenine glycosylase, partial [Thermoanaerobaculia bacterium]